MKKFTRTKFKHKCTTINLTYNSYAKYDNPLLPQYFNISFIIKMIGEKDVILVMFV